MTINQCKSSQPAITIAGLSGRFPQSENAEELWEHLLNGHVLYQPDTFPYPKIFTKTPKSRGALKDTSHFDSEFFGYDHRSANALDPQLRLLLEVVYEALWDAGIAPESWFGSRTGFYLGSSFEETGLTVRSLDKTIDPGQHFSSRVSYHFNWKGPSMTVDTACASSLNALAEAYTGLINKTCDQAVVAGICLHLKPNVTICFSELEMLSKSGKSRCLDASADGYIRSEAIVAVVLQRENQANRVYGRIIGAATSSDGYTKEGITFPCREVQIDTMKSALNRSSVNPLSVDYVEAHVTGTSVGDPIETSAIIQAYRSTNTEKPLIIGCLKGNIGHTEASAGLCALIKALKIFQNNMIPMNVGMELPNPRIESLREGQLITPRTNLPWKGDLIAIDAFGFGGSNTHCLISAPNKRFPIANIKSNQTKRLIFLCNRNEIGLREMCSFIEGQSHTTEYLTLIDQIAINTTNESGMNWRGFVTANFDGNKINLTNLKFNHLTRRSPFIIFFDHLITDCSSFCQNYEPIDSYLNKKIEICYDFLKKHGHKRRSIEENSSIVLIINQLAWADLITKHLKIAPDLVVGYSLGWIAASYAANQASWDTCLVSLADLVKLIPTKQTNTDPDIRGRFESKAVKMKLTDLYNQYKTDANFFIHLNDSGNHVDSEDLVMLNVSSKLTLTKLSVNCELKKSSDNHDVLSILGNLYICGYTPDIRAFNEQRSLPVSSNCPSLGHLINWNHQQTFDNIAYPEFFRDSFHTIHRIDLMDPEYADLLGYSIEGQTICPISCYIWIIWDHLVKLRCSDQRHRYHSFEIHDLKVDQVVNLSEPVEFRVVSNPDTGEFAIKFSADYRSIVTGFAAIVDDSEFSYSSYLDLDTDNSDDNSVLLTSEDFYFDLSIRGWNSGESFKNVTSFNSNGSQASIKFNGNWITFFESILITPLLLDSKDSTMALPMKLDWFRCDPLILNECLKIQRKSGSEGNNGFTFQLDVDSQIIGTSGLLTRFPDYETIPFTLIDPELHYRHQVFLPLTSHIYSNQDLHNAQTQLIAQINHLLTPKNPSNNKKIGSLPHNDSSSLHQMLSVAISTFQDKIFVSPDMIVAIDEAFEKDLITKSAVDLLQIHLGLLEENSSCNKVTKIYQVGRINAHSYDSNCDFIFRKIRSHYTFETLPIIDSNSISSADLVIYNHVSLGLSLREFNIDEEYSFLSNFDSLLPSSFLLILIREENFTFEEALCKLLSGQKAKQKVSSKLLVDYLQKKDFVIISEHIIDNGCPIKSILLRKLDKSRDVTKGEQHVIYINERSFDWVDQLKTFINNNESDKIWLISNGSYRSGLIGLALSLKEESFGHKIRAIHAVGFNHKEDFQIFNELRNRDLLINVQRQPNGPWGTYRHIELDPCDEVMVYNDSAYLKWTFEKNIMDVSKSMELPVLSWYRSHPTTEDTSTLVHYSTFNYFDKLIARENSLFNLTNENCTVGWDFSGYSVSQGKKVMGLCNGNGTIGTLSSDSIIILIDVPDNLSLASAATIPVPYSIAYYCLHILGSINPSSKVFINGSLDGIELAIISLCFSINCQIYIRLDSPSLQKDYCELFPFLSALNFIPTNQNDLDKCLFHSTSGSGVDVAINLGSQDIIQFLPSCCSFGGKIIHIGSFDEKDLHFMNNHLMTICASIHSVEPFDFYRNLLNKDDKLKQKISVLLSNGLLNGHIKPLPLSIIKRNDVVTEGLEQLKAKSNFERVVIAIRNEVTTNPIPVKCVARTYFNPKKCYILIGGLGGIGLQLTRWMVDRGAKNIVIISRSGIQSQYQRFIIDRLKSRQTKSFCNLEVQSSTPVSITVITAPIIDQDSCGQIIKESIDNYGPIGGIFNLAGILRSGLFENQSPETFKEVCLPKIEVTEYFDKFSRVYCPKLDYFVCFSSISALGILGEPNYGYANSYMERLCEERRFHGLPGTAIQWGAVGNVGMAQHFTTSIAGSAFRRVLGVINDLDKFLQLPYSTCYAVQHASKQEPTVSGKANLLQRIGHILGCQNLDKMDGNITLGALGLDSLQAIEVKNLIDTTINISLSNIAILKLSLSELSALAEEALNASTEGDDIKVEESVLINLTDKGTEPIFFFPPAFFDFLSMMPVAKALNRTVVGVQLTEEVRSLGTFESISNFYAETILAAYPNLTRYDFVGYSFGCTVSFELAKVLQKMIGKPQIDRIVFIDASPYGLKKLGQKTMKMFLAGYPAWEIFISTMQFMGVKIDEKTKKLLEQSEDDELMYKEIVTQTLIDAGMNGPADMLLENAAGLIDRAYYLGSMSELGTFDGDALFIQVINKAVSSSGTMSLVNEGLSKIIKGSLKTVVYNATHFDILKVYAREVAAEIEKVMP